MFPEYRALITKLKHKDYHFTRLFEKHNELDHKVQNMQASVTPADQIEIERMKKEKLLLKDRIYATLKRHDVSTEPVT